MTSFKIGDREIGNGKPVYIILEAANCHEGNFEVAKKMVAEAVGSGADAIKFQRHIVEDEMISAHPKFGTQNQRSLKLEWLKELKTIVEGHGMDFICTPFSRLAADDAAAMGVKVIKIGSGEATDLDYLDHVAQKHIPTIFSRGMTSFDEIAEAGAVFKKHGTPYMVLHCTSIYPAVESQLFLDSIAVMKERFQVPIGYSSHIPSVTAAVNAAALGADLLEVHYTLDRKTVGTTDHKVSLEPQEIREVVRLVRELETMKGVKEGVMPEEQPVIEWAHHSVVTVKDIKSGETITREHLSTKRPLWDGIHAKHLYEVVGKKAARDVANDQILHWEDVVK